MPAGLSSSRTVDAFGAQPVGKRACCGRWRRRRHRRACPRPRRCARPSGLRRRACRLSRRAITPRTPASSRKVTFGRRADIAAHHQFQRRAAAEQDREILVARLRRDSRRAAAAAIRPRKVKMRAPAIEQFCQQSRIARRGSASSAVRGTRGCGEAASRRGVPNAGTRPPASPAGGGGSRSTSVTRRRCRRTRARRRGPRCPLPATRTCSPLIRL